MPIESGTIIILELHGTSQPLASNLVWSHYFSRRHQWLAAVRHSVCLSVFCTGLSGRPKRMWRRYPGRWQSVKKTVFCSWQSMKQECESYASYASNTSKFRYWDDSMRVEASQRSHGILCLSDMTWQQHKTDSALLGFVYLKPVHLTKMYLGTSERIVSALKAAETRIIQACTALLIPTVGRYLLSSFQPLTKSRDLFEKVEHFVHAAKFDEFDVPNSHELFGFRMIPETHQRMQWHYIIILDSMTVGIGPRLLISCTPRLPPVVHVSLPALWLRANTSKDIVFRKTPKLLLPQISIANLGKPCE